MKLKGVNPFEQHVEKIVLVSVSAVLLVVVALQFLVAPNQIKIQGSSATVEPGPAFRDVEQKAKALSAIMERSELTGVLPAEQQYDLVNQLRKVREAPIAPARIAALGPVMSIEGVSGSGAVTLAERVNPVAVPAPAGLLAAAHRGTISPTEPLGIPALKPLIPAEQPFDKASVSVECVFDGSALRSALTSPGQAPEVKAIPASWWRDSVEILNVRLERQELRPDGSWSEPSVVPAAPGKFDLTEQLRSVKSPVELADAVFEARSAADDICRPAFYSQVAGPEWRPPTERTASTFSPEIQGEIKRNLDAMRSHDRRLEPLRQERANITAATVRQAGGDGRNTGGGGGKGAGGGQAQPTTGNSGRTFATEEQKQQALKNIEKRIADVEAERQKTVDALKARGLDEAGVPLPVAPEAPENVKVAKPLLDDPAVKLWSHDMTITPGKTYRYRASVGINNPMFARTSALIEEQRPLAAAPVTYSVPSQWSDPVEVLPDQFYFLTSAQEAGHLGDQLAPPRATAEVFRFFYGYFRKATVSLEPGDVIETSIRLPDPAKLPIFDLSTVITDATPANPAVPVPTQPTPGKGGGQATEEGGGRDGRGLQTGQAAPTVAELPANAKPYPNPTIPATINVLLLDVTKSIGSETSGQPQAVVRTEGGAIAVLSPDEQRKLASYQAAAVSAKEGETQGQPVIPEPKKTPIRPPPRDPTTPRPPPPGGGGGGAGGG
jgi:hypothetical protein